METLNALFVKKKHGITPMGRLYSEEQLLRVHESAMDTKEDQGTSCSSRLQPVELVLDTRHPLPVREFVKIVENEGAMPPCSTQLRRVVVVLDTSPSIAPGEVVNVVEKQDVSLPVFTQLPPVHLVIDISHPLAFREVMKFAEIEATNPSSAEPQRRVQLVLDTR